MSTSPSPLAAFSDALADTVERTARSIVAVGSGGHAVASGFVLKPGVVIAADEALESDDDLAVLLPDGRRAAATLAGRDPSTDVAVLRIDDDTVPPLPAAAAREPRAGGLVLTVGRRPEGVIAALGTVALVGGAWRSLRGGEIDRLLRLGLRMDRRSEGGAAVDANGDTLGMAVFGPRRAVLVIPLTTVTRVADELIARGRIARGYLGLGLQPVRLDEAKTEALGLAQGRGLIVVSVDPQGPGRQAGVLIGDVVTAWDGEEIGGLRSVFARLGTGSVGKTVALSLLRAGQPAAATLTIGERPAA
jgi:S1-C subfamily serine protease